jgi:hypothetical protein
LIYMLPPGACSVGDKEEGEGKGNGQFFKK